MTKYLYAVRNMARKIPAQKASEPPRMVSLFTPTSNRILTVPVIATNSLEKNHRGLNSLTEYDLPITLGARLSDDSLMSAEKLLAEKKKNRVQLPLILATLTIRELMTPYIFSWQIQDDKELLRHGIQSVARKYVEVLADAGKQAIKFSADMLDTLELIKSTCGIEFDVKSLESKNSFTPNEKLFQDMIKSCLIDKMKEARIFSTAFESTTPREAGQHLANSLAIEALTATCKMDSFITNDYIHSVLEKIGSSAKHSESEEVFLQYERLKNIILNNRVIALGLDLKRSHSEAAPVKRHKMGR